MIQHGQLLGAARNTNPGYKRGYATGRLRMYADSSTQYADMYVGTRDT